MLKSKPKFIFIKAVFEMEKCFAPQKGSKQMYTLFLVAESLSSAGVWKSKPFSCAQLQDHL